MALDGNRLGTKIANAIKASIPAPDAKITDSQLEAMWQAVATEIVNEFNQNGVVTVQNVQPGTGTANGTIA